MKRICRAMSIMRLAVIGVILLVSSSQTQAVSPTSEELVSLAGWVKKNLGPDAPSLPFSFTYGGKPSSSFLSQWTAKRTLRRLDESRTQQTISYTDPQTKLTLRAEIVQYQDFPTVEWTLYFKNGGTADTPILEDIRALDLPMTEPQPVDCGYVLHHNRGTLVVTPVLDVPQGRHDFEPLATRLPPYLRKTLMPSHGRSCAAEFPYFNVEVVGKQRGMIVALGWLGRWMAEFARDAGPTLTLRAGQELTRFKLHPGEEARSPMVVLLLWQGDRVRSQNLWRRWMLAHNSPRPGGKPFPPSLAAMDCNYFPGLVLQESGEKEFIRKYAERKLLGDIWWIDAGWYKMEGVFGGASTPPRDYSNTGTWEEDKERFPNGLKSVFDEARSRGAKKSMLWFEPERVRPGSWLDKNHPEWLLAWRADPTHRLLNFGHPGARQWAIEHFSRLVEQLNLDVYRQDFNFDPLPYWRQDEAPDRQGLNEIKHIAGMYAFWDELVRRHPNLLIDNCASGGHRNDVETLRRSLPLWRSDCFSGASNLQCQSYGLSAWIPYYGTNLGGDMPDGNDRYAMRSALAPLVSLMYDTRREDLDYDAIRRGIAEWRSVADCLLGDYYPLTDYSAADGAWIAWQFDRPEQGKGVVQVFCRPGSPFTAARFRLQGLAPEAEYEILDLDGGKPVRLRGTALIGDGLSIHVTRKPAAKLLTYSKIR